MAKAQHPLNCSLVNSEEWYFYTPDKLNLYIHEFGKGDTVLVIHGGFGAEHSYLLDALIPLQNEFHFICYDQRGSLRSPAPDSLLSFDLLLTDIELFRKEMRLGKLTLFAHSMGTRLAMAYTAKYPDNVKKLIMTSAHKPRSADGRLRELALFYLENRKNVEDVKKQVLPSDTTKWLKKHDTYKWRISYASVNLYDIKKWQQMRGGVAFYNQRSASLLYSSAPNDWNYTRQLNQSTISIKVIESDYDYLNFTALPLDSIANNYLIHKRMTSEEEKKYTQLNPVYWSDFKKDLPNLKIYSIENAGHCPWIDQPVIFSNYLNEALND